MSVMPPPTPRAGRREWIGLGVIALPCLLYSMDLTVLDLAVPMLTADLRPTSAQLLWILDIYGFVLAGMLIPMGTLGDRIGRRRLLFIGAAAFGIASVAAAFSRSAEMLIVSRAVLGVAGATLAPSTLSLIRNMFLDAEQRSTAIGVWATSYAVGGAIGPVVGGILLGRFWWGSVFLLSVPVMLLLLAVGPMLLPEFRVPNAGKIDILSALLSLATVLLAIYPVKQIAQGSHGWVSVACVVTGVVTGVAFVLRQRRLTDPLIDLALFRSRAFSAALGAYTLATFVVFGVLIFIAQYLQLVRGYTPLESGVVTLPMFVSFIAGAMFAPRLARRFGAATVICGGLIVSAIGLMIFARLGVESGLGSVFAGFLFFSVGLGPVSPLATDIIVGAAPPERAGVASALSETGSELGGALGIAVLGSLGTAVYRGAMEHVAPGLSVGAQAAARSTLGGAIDVARQLPATGGADLADAARRAFSLSFTSAAVASAVIVIATAIIVMPNLRRDSNPA